MYFKERYTSKQFVVLTFLLDQASDWKQPMNNLVPKSHWLSNHRHNKQIYKPSSVWYLTHKSLPIRRVTMSFEIGKKCEGLHEGRWYVCTILTCEKDGYSVTLDEWVRYHSRSWICSPAIFDWQSKEEALDSEHKFQQAPTRWRDINRCRGFQKASFGTSSGSLPWAADCWMWKRSTDCRFPWCTATACIYTRGQSYHPHHHTIRTSANSTTSADPCQFYSSAVHGH